MDVNLFFDEWINIEAINATVLAYNLRKPDEIDTENLKKSISLIKEDLIKKIKQEKE